MAIATRCPHCETAYTLKDELGGKRVTCKTCRRVFPVPAAPPAPVKTAAPAKPAMDAEQLALSVFADADKKPEPEPEQIKITVKCQFCDFENVFDGRLAGKNAPCQNEECRKIIKVPALVKAEAKDWRNVAKRPSMAKTDEGAPEGAWGNVHTQAVSREAIVHAEADRIEEAEPVSWGKRIAYGLAGLGALLVGVVVVLWLLRMRTEGKQEHAIEQALEYVSSDTKSKTPKLKKPASSLIHLLAGQYRFAHNDAAKAKVEFIAARNTLDAGSSFEHNAALMEVAAGFGSLAGNKPEVDAGSRLDWEKDKLNADLRTTLAKLPQQPTEEFRDMRALAFRRLTRVLTEAGKPEAVGPLANAVCPEQDRAEILAVIGLELLSLGQRDEAEKLAKLASTLQPKDAPSPVALWLAIAAPDAPPDKKKAGDAAARKIAPSPEEKGLLTPLMRIGYCEGWARQGNFDKARTWANKPGKPEERLRALAAIAGVAVEVRKGDLADLESCAKLIESDMKNAYISPWLLLRLVRLANRAENPELAAKFAAAISDPGGKAWASYEVLQGKLRAEGKQPAEWTRADEVGGPDRLAHWLACAAMARHNAEAASAASVMSQIKKWDDVKKPFGYAGVALAER